MLLRSAASSLDTVLLLVALGLWVVVWYLLSPATDALFGEWFFWVITGWVIVPVVKAYTR
jgi:hypothetical protein